jgi:hypothetical protein
MAPETLCLRASRRKFFFAPRLGEGTEKRGQGEIRKGHPGHTDQRRPGHQVRPRVGGGGPRWGPGVGEEPGENPGAWVLRGGTGGGKGSALNLSPPPNHGVRRPSSRTSPQLFPGCPLRSIHARRGAPFRGLTPTRQKLPASPIPAAPAAVPLPAHSSVASGLPPRRSYQKDRKSWEEVRGLLRRSLRPPSLVRTTDCAIG